MKIAIIAEVYLPKIDGVVGRTVNLIRELVNGGDDVRVFAPDVGAAHGDARSSSPVPVTSFPAFPFPQYPEYRIGRPDQRLVQQLADWQPDVIHFINPFAFGFQCYDLLLRSTRRVGRTLPPVVFSFHTLYGEFVRTYRALRPLSPLLWWLMREYHNAADINLTVSQPMLEDLERRGFRNVRLWQPAVDSDLFDPSRASNAMRQRLLGDHPNPRLLLTVSRLAPEKNVGFLRGVLAQLPQTTLAIVGDGPQRLELERQFSGLPVTFVGYLKGRDLAAAYASADAFVYSSETETMGNVVLESLASGLPVVAVRAGGIPSLLTHGLEGLLFSPGDVDAATESVQWLLQTSARRTAFSHAARLSTTARTWQHSAAGVRREYEQLVSGSGQTRIPPGQRRPAARVLSSALVQVFRAASALKPPKLPAPSPEPVTRTA
jgi:glycosyltransferase involved in cell wall biosynthesis